MKNILYKIFGLTIVLGLTYSCSNDELDLAPISSIAENDFFKNDQEVFGGLIAIYDGLQNVPAREFAMTEMRSDNAQSKTSEGDWGQFQRFEVKSTNLAILNYWRENYNVIYRANLVMKYLNVVTSASNKTLYDGEARFTRALAYFNLVRAYGGVAIVDKVVVPTDPDFQDYLPRNTADQVLDFITTDLEIAVASLPEASGTYYGRATKGAAQALLAKVYLTRHNYAAAKPLLAELVLSKYYVLEKEYKDVFYTERNKEILFAIPFVDDDVNESQDFSFEMTAGGQASGLDYPTLNLISNLNPLDTQRNSVLINPAANTQNGKFLTNSSNARLCGNDWIVLRFADVLLMNAEAIMEGKDVTSSLQAITSFNLIRARAGLSTLAVDGSAKLTKEMLLDERRIEFAFENQRLYDLVRFDEATAVLSKYAVSQGSTFEPTDILLPIPQAEINVSFGLLKQNPGY